MIPSKMDGLSHFVVRNLQQSLQKLDVWGTNHHFHWNFPQNLGKDRPSTTNDTNVFWSVCFRFLGWFLCPWIMDLVFFFFLGFFKNQNPSPILVGHQARKKKIHHQFVSLDMFYVLLEQQQKHLLETVEGFTTYHQPSPLVWLVAALFVPWCHGEIDWWFQCGLDSGGCLGPWIFFWGKHTHTHTHPKITIKNIYIILYSYLNRDRYIDIDI